MLSRIRKAIVAGIGAGVAAYVTGGTDGVVSTADWITVVGSTIVIGVVTYFVPNARPPAAKLTTPPSRYPR